MLKKTQGKKDKRVGNFNAERKTIRMNQMIIPELKETIFEIKTH